MGKKKLKWRLAKRKRAPCRLCGGAGAVRAGDGQIKNCPRCDGTGKEPD